MPQTKKLQEILGIDLPLLIAPMFLVSNTDMVIEAMKKGGAGCIPALNYRKISELKIAIRVMKAAKPINGAFGINIIVNPSNLKYRDQLTACCDEGVDFMITSLGNPKEVIEKARRTGIKVFCDVVNLSHALKAESLGCDALIAVNNKAGGHKGDLDPEALIKQLVANTNLPIISAGGIANKKDLDTVLSFGAAGVSIGSPFIASLESNAAVEYKEACVSYGARDIVMTKKISGTPCTVINTPYVQKVGLNETWIEKGLQKLDFLKKWVKLLRYLKGIQDVINSAQKVTYKTVWVAGTSIEYTHKIEPVSKIIDRFID